MTAESGHTLVELVAVIVLVGVLAIVGGRFVALTADAAVSTEQRVALASTASATLERMALDLHQALPGSVRVRRVGNTEAIEFVPVVASARYRLCRDKGGGGPPGGGGGGPGNGRGPLGGGGAGTVCDRSTVGQGGGGDGDRLEIGLAADAFDTLGPVRGLSAINTPGAGAACARGGTCLAINNIDGEIYDGHDVSPVTDAAVDSLAHDAGGSTSPFTGDGDGHSPTQRVYGFNTVVSYVCNPGSGELRRYAGYGLQSNQPVPPDGGGVLVADGITGCDFGFTVAGTDASQGVARFGVRLADGEAEVALVRQAAVVRPR